MSVFAVQTIPEGSSQPTFIVVPVESRERALAVAAEKTPRMGQSIPQWWPPSRSRISRPCLAPCRILAGSKGLER